VIENAEKSHLKEIADIGHYVIHGERRKEAQLKQIEPVGMSG
jgi:hypothetical protein